MRLSPPIGLAASAPLREVVSGAPIGRGIVVLSASLQVVYMSGEAAALIKSLQRAETGLAIGTVPSVIEEFCAGMLQASSGRAYEGNGISCELRRVAGDPEQPILLRGFVLRNVQETDKSHMVIIMEERSGSC